MGRGGGDGGRGASGLLDGYSLRLMNHLAPFRIQNRPMAIVGLYFTRLAQVY